MMIRKKKQGRILCAVLALCVLLSACEGESFIGQALEQLSERALEWAAGDAASSAALPQSPAVLPQGDAEPDPVPGAGPFLPDGVRWVIAPYLKADSIYPVFLSRAIDEQYFNASGQISRDGLNEVMTDGKHGLIDLDGTWAAPCEFSDITCGYEGKYLLTRDEGDGVQAEYIFGEDGTLRRLEPGETDEQGRIIRIGITGTTPDASLCWVDDTQQLAMLSEGSTVDAIDPLDYPAPAYWLSSATPEGVRQLSEGLTDQQIYRPFVLTDGTRPVNDERYQCIGCISEGVVFAQKDGSWGVLNTAGETVFPFEYGGVSPWGTCYPATEGTLILYDGETCALYAVSGAEIIPFGFFEQLLPACGGRLWAKQGGRWGVLALEAS